MTTLMKTLAKALGTALKRTLDVTGSLVLLLALSPLLSLIALAVRLSSPGPAIYRQTRAGYQARPFTIYKFRTMVQGAEKIGAGYYWTENDPRITRVGRFLRTYSLDELPQLWNVLKGDMSLVGPRPALPFQLRYYSEEQLRRVSVRPGLTGLAQVSGRNELPWGARIEYDLEYIDRWSLALDFAILWRTVLTVLRHEGVRHDQPREEIERY